MVENPATYLVTPAKSTGITDIDLFLELVQPGK